MKAWMIKSPSNNLLPCWSHWTRSGAIKEFVKDCDWYVQPGWKRLYRDGFRAVKVIVSEVGVSNAQGNKPPLTGD